MVVKIFGIISLLFFAVSCNTTEPPPPPPPEPEKTITLTLEDISCIEAWIKLTTTNIQFPNTITLKLNDQTKDTINLASTDTLLYLDSLLPNQTYLFQSLYHPINQSEIKSNQLSVTTMDTTSHDFTWQTWEFGEHGNSILRDVAIIDENNIWAVGEIYMNKPNGEPDPIFYNAVHWDGQNWELIRILYGGNIWSVRSVYAFNENDIWFSAYVRYYNGNFIAQPIPAILMGWSVNKIWGSSSNDLYIVGDNGNIAWYNGSLWTKIESGTEVDLLDIWGTPDGSTIWVTGNDSGNNFHSVLLKYNGTTWYKLYEGPPNNQNNGYNIGLLRAVWTNSNLFTFLMNTDAVYRQYNKPELDIILSVELNDAGFAMRGSEMNNTFVIGQHGYVVHNNGISYKEIEGLKNSSDRLLSVDVKDNVSCIVGQKYLGFIYNRAIIHRLK